MWKLQRKTYQLIIKCEANIDYKAIIKYFSKVMHPQNDYIKQCAHLKRCLTPAHMNSLNNH